MEIPKVDGNNVLESELLNKYKTPYMKNPNSA